MINLKCFFFFSSLGFRTGLGLTREIKVPVFVISDLMMKPCLPIT